MQCTLLYIQAVLTWWNKESNGAQNMYRLSLFHQGDEMKKIGMQPIPMMDRDKKDEVPQGQVQPDLKKGHWFRSFWTLNECI